jgi:hypothetical protein
MPSGALSKSVSWSPVMTSTPKSLVTQESSKAIARTTIFGDPPLLEGEDTQAYDDLLAQVSGAVKPSDIIEEIWIRDVVDLTWEILRWRQIRVSVIERFKLRQPSGDIEKQDWLNTTRSLVELKRLDYLTKFIITAESRRNAALREIERRRATFAQTLRDKVKNVEDAKFETVEAKAIIHEDVARAEGKNAA